MVPRNDSTIRARLAFSCARDACADKPRPVNILGPSKMISYAFKSIQNDFYMDVETVLMFQRHAS